MYSKFTLKYHFRVREITFDEIQVWSRHGRIKLSLDWCRRQFDALRSLVLTPWPLQTLIKFLKTLPLQSFLFPKNHLIQNLPSCKHSNAKRHFPSLPNKTPTPEPGFHIPLKFLMLNKILPAPKNFILQAADTLKALQAPSKPANVLKPTVPVFPSHSTPTLSPIPR